VVEPNLAKGFWFRSTIEATVVYDTGCAKEITNIAKYA